MLKLARCLYLLIASLATLPSMSLIPFVPFASKAGYSEASTIGDRPLPAFVRLSRRLPPTFDFGVTRRRGKQQAMTAHPPWRAGSALARASGFSRWQHYSAAGVAVKSQMPGTFAVRPQQVNIRRLLAGRSAKSLEKRGAPF